MVIEIFDPRLMWIVDTFVRDPPKVHEPNLASCQIQFDQILKCLDPSLTSSKLQRKASVL